MKFNRRFYQSYLLRLWRETIEGEWRVTIQNISTGDCQHFSSLEALFRFLDEQTTQPLNARPGVTGASETVLSD